MSLLLLAVVALAPARAEQLEFEGYLQGLPGRGGASGAGLRLGGDGRTFLAAEGRVGTGGALDCGCASAPLEHWWSGRATAGLDVLGRSDALDLTLGIFLGSVGSWEPVAVVADPTAGFELGLGLNVGRLALRYRHADGMRGPMEGWLTENEVRLSYEVLDNLLLFGQMVRFNPGDEVPRGGYGVGAGVRF